MRKRDAGGEMHLPPATGFDVLFVVFFSVLSFFGFCLPPMACGGSGTKFLTLERAIPLPAGVELEALKARDRVRHGRLLSGVIDFPIRGSSNLYSVGLYYTPVKLGNPPKEFYVQIDTGSDILWVTCSPCNGCPTSSGLNVPLEFFRPDASSTSSLLSCADRRCISALQDSEAMCISSGTQSNVCGYSLRYGDGSGTSGYYISDTMYFETIMTNEQAINTSATVIFGCSNSQFGELTKPDRAVGGIFGFGQNEFSVISQLYSLGMAPKVFSHCLKGSDNGGGILIIGEIVEPGMTYTPLVQSQSHYTLNLLSIAVNGQILPIDSSTFATSSTQGTIVDSGTTLAYLPEQAYDVFVNAIIASVSLAVQYFIVNGNLCFALPSSLDEIFPSVTLKFEGNAAMVLKPQDYLTQQTSTENSGMWCMGWQKNVGRGTVILGDIVLKDKIFVYDLARQRIGWAYYDCSLPVNVTTSYGERNVVNSGDLSMSSSLRSAICSEVTIGILSFLVHNLLLFLVL